jgi:hypothetical protein
MAPARMPRRTPPAGEAPPWQASDPTIGSPKVAWEDAPQQGDEL